MERKSDPNNPERRKLNGMEREIIHDMFVLGVDQQFLADMFGVKKRYVYVLWLRQMKAGRSQVFNLAQASQAVSRFLLMRFARDLHNLPPSRAIEMLPDLLRIKDDPVGQTSETLDALVVPEKSPYSPLEEPDPLPPLED